jgi:hypothetical protein
MTYWPRKNQVKNLNFWLFFRILYMENTKNARKY